MSRFGWAYVNDVITGSGPGGSDKAIQFASGSTLSGSTNFTYNYLSNSLAQGNSVIASGIYSHAEGYNTTASANYSHAEGEGNTASGMSSHAEGRDTIASGYVSHAEGQSTQASSFASHAEGEGTKTVGFSSHAEGQNTLAYGNSSHAEGYYTTASADYSHAEGRNTITYGTASHAEGLDTTTYGNYSHTEGAATITYGIYSHAEGSITRASASYSHAEGRLTWTYGIGSHAEGLSTTTYGEASHAEGYNTTASANYSHAEGIGTIASGSGQTVVGTYNIANSSSLFIIGNGASNASRSDIFLVNTGSVIVSGNLYATVISASTYLGITGSGGTPGGSDKAIQFASGSSFSGSTNFTFDYTTNVLSLTGTTLISGSLTATNTITATSASFLDYVQLGTSLSDEAYFNASLKTNIQPAATNDVDLGASSKFWKTGYITTLSSSAISSSVSVKTGEITATAIVLNGNLSSSGNINGSGLQISGGGSFGSTVNVTGSVSASVNLQTAGDVTAGMNLTINNFANIKNGLTVTGSSIITGSLTVIGIMSASSIVGDGNNITGINGANVNGTGEDWTIQFKNGVGGTLTGSSNLTFSGSTFILSGNLNVTGAIKGGYATYSSNTSIPNTSYFVGLNSVSSVLTASLLAATNYPQGQTLIFKDIGGYAGTNNILVQASGSETIDGASGVSLTTNSSSVSIISNGSNGFYIVGIV